MDAGSSSWQEPQHRAPNWVVLKAASKEFAFLRRLYPFAYPYDHSILLARFQPIPPFVVFEQEKKEDAAEKAKNQASKEGSSFRIPLDFIQP